MIVDLNSTFLSLEVEFLDNNVQSSSINNNHWKMTENYGFVQPSV